MNTIRSGLLIVAICLANATLRVSWPDQCRGDDASTTGPVPPNFIIIFCDNLGYGDIEPFGSTLHRTPNLNRMAENGRRFTHFYVTAGVCTPSRASIMTGCYAQRIGMHDNPRDGQVLRPVSPYGLNPSEITVAETLRDAGYITGIFGKWHLGDQPEFLPIQQGFDEFLGIPYSDDMTRKAGQRLGERLQGKHWPDLPLIKNDVVIEAPTDRNMLTKVCTENVLSFIERNYKEPFFIYFPQPMPGSTVAPFASSDFKGKSLNGPWGDSIEEIDWSTGQILNKLEQLDIDDKTLVVWLSDNGAPMAKDMSQLSRGSNRPLHGRGYTTSEGAFRTPTIMHWPGHVPRGTTCDELSTTMDLLPTFARLAGTNPATGIDGHDIRPLILGELGAKSPYKAFFYYYRDQLQAVRSGPWKLFVPLNSFERHPHFKRGQSRQPLLFNLVDDIACERNVAHQHAETVARLTQFAECAKADLGDRNRVGIGQRAAGKTRETPTPRSIK